MPNLALTIRTLQLFLLACNMLLALTVNAQPKHPENYQTGDCILYYDHAKVKDMHRFIQLPKLIREKMDSIMHKQYKAFEGEMQFKAARMYSPKFFPDSLEAEERKMYVDVLYSLKMKGNRAWLFESLDREMEDDIHVRYIALDDEYVEEYCVYFTFDTLGNRIRPVYMPSEQWLDKPLISAQAAKDILQKKAEGTYRLTYIEMYFNMREQCFVWIVEGMYQINGKGIYETNEINAHTGQIMEAYPKERRRGGF
jgi:hypothetical protein